MVPLHISKLIVAAAALCALACGESHKEDRPSTAPANQQGIPDPPASEMATGATQQRSVYVPAYSHVPGGQGAERRSLLSILLSARNIDPTVPIVLTHVDYFDTSGHRVRRYLDRPRVLRPLETAEFWVDTSDVAGGSGANFLVYWEGPSDVQPLLTESVMVGHLGAGFISFTSRGIELKRRPDEHAFDSNEAPAINAPDAAVAE